MIEDSLQLIRGAILSLTLLEIWDIKNWIHHDYSIEGCEQRRLTYLVCIIFWPWKKSVVRMAAPHLGHDLFDWVKAVLKVACWRLDPKDNGEELESLKGMYIQPQVEVSPASPCSLQAHRALRALRDSWGSLQLITTWLTSYLNLLSMNISTQ